MAGKSVRTDPRRHAAEGDERIRTAVCAPSDDPAYEEGALVRVVRLAPGFADAGLVGRVGRVEHRGPVQPDGCYVRFWGGAGYAWVKYDEIQLHARGAVS